MIPKVIHYCWFGRGEKPELAKKCIASWKRFCPDYKIVEWNEDNFDLDTTAYTRWCYDNKKWAFLSDFVRLYVVNQNGGVYFDTDVEVVKPIDHLLECEAFYGWQNDTEIASGLGFGAVAGHYSLEAMLNEYAGLAQDEQGNFLLTICPILNTRALQRFGLVLDGSKQVLGDICILTADYMNPYDDPTGRLLKTENTVSIHWCAKSWISPALKLRSFLTRPLHRLFGTDCFAWLKRKE